MGEGDPDADQEEESETDDDEAGDHVHEQERVLVKVHAEEEGNEEGGGAAGAGVHRSDRVAELKVPLSEGVDGRHHGGETVAQDGRTDVDHGEVSSEKVDQRPAADEEDKVIGNDVVGLKLQ